jgi:chaperonin GroES
MATLLPLGEHIVVKPKEKINQTSSGILLPEKEERPEEGEVIAVGPGARGHDGSRMPIDGIAVGDTVLFKKYSADEFKLAGEKYLVVRESDVIAKLP